MKDLIGGAWDDIRPHVEDSIRNGDFAMSKQHYGVYGLDNQPWQSNYHDHLCQCPGCRGLDQDDYEFQVEQSGAIEINQSDIAYVWQELQATPSYCERYRLAATDAPLIVLMEDEPRHTDETPFCPDADCPCHSDETLFEEFIARPIAEGRLKTWEAQALLWPEQ